MLLIEILNAMCKRNSDDWLFTNMYEVRIHARGYTSYIF